MPRFLKGLATNILLGLMTGVFLLIWLAGWETQAVARAALFPIRFLDGDAAFAAFTPLVPVWFTPISSAFLHSGFLHLIFNGLMLFFCGRYVEHVLGWRLFLLLFVLGCYGASAAEILFSTYADYPVVGASGGISAFLAAYAMLYSRNDIKAIGPISGHIIRMVWLMLAWIGIQLAIAVIGATSLGIIAIYAHIGGFAVGLLATKPLLRWRFRNA
jgi:membrane associated rhomboid family serine protease